jgi:hypothetical protein
MGHKYAVKALSSLIGVSSVLPLRIKPIFRWSIERKGYLYIIVDGVTLKLKNPFDIIPDYVKLYKSKGEWKIKKEKENKE